MPYGYERTAWDAAKREARAILQERARQPAHPTITYSELAAGITSIRFGAEEYAFHEILGEISVEEHARGKGMLSALVVHKGDGTPGGGFFTLATKLGHVVREKTEFWIAEVQRVIAANAG